MVGLCEDTTLGPPECGERVVTCTKAAKNPHQSTYGHVHTRIGFGGEKQICAVVHVMDCTGKVKLL